MEYKYKAFISYRHLEPDMQAAERLQKLLEAYKPPKNLGKTKDNWRIFRDVSELQSSSDLSEDIKNAIENSEYLIVICSPKYTESKWCMQELTRFRELHGNTNKNIITLLVSGEPHESFPEELTYTEMTTTNDKVEEVKVKVEVEPLAANIKADTLKESMKKLNTEYLRIAAPLLECDFNDLYQREKRREAARRRRIFGGVSGILSLITIISVASAVTISGKNVQIKKQNSQIKEQNEQIEQKNKDLLVENAGHLAVESENLFKESSLIPAIQKAVEALPSDGEDKPVIPEAEYALSRELGMFKHEQLVPQLALKHECAVEKLSFMGAGKTVVSQDATGIYFWDAETGKLIRKITASDSEFASASKGSSNKLNAFFDIYNDKTGTYFHSTDTPSRMTYEVSSVFNRIYTDFVHSVSDEEPGTDGELYIYNSDSTVWKIDGATGEVIWKAEPSEDAYEYDSVDVLKNYVIRMYQDKNVMSDGTEILGEDVFLELIDRESGKIADTVKVTSSSAGMLGFMMDNTIHAIKDNVLYVYNDSEKEYLTYDIKNHELAVKNELPVEDAVNEGMHIINMQFVEDDAVITSCNILGFQTETSITRYDSDLKEKKWRTSITANYNQNGSMFLMPADETGYEHDVLAVVTGLTFSFVDYENGSVIKTIKLDSEVVDVSYSRRGFIMLTLSSGEEYVVSLGHYTKGDDSSNAVYRVQKIDTALSLSSYSRNKYVTAANYSNTAYIQYSKQNPMYTDIDTGEYMYYRDIAAVDSTGSNAAVVSTYYPDGEYHSDSNLVVHLFIYSPASGNSLTEVKDMEDYRINSAAFIGKDKLIVNASPKESSGYYGIGSEMFCVDVQSKKAEKLADAPSANYLTVNIVPTENGAFYLSDYDSNIVFINADGKTTPWAVKAEGAFSLDRGIVNMMYAVSDSRAAMLVCEEGDSTPFLEVYSFETGKTVKFDCDLDADEGLEVQRIFWQNSDTVGVFFNNRTVSLFDAESGALRTTVSLVGTSQEPVSAAPVSDDTFAVLCRDSRIYEMNADGFTGRSCRLDFSDEEENDIRECDSSNADKLEINSSADSFRKFVIWDGGQAWMLDTEKFSVRYRIDDFAAAPANGDMVFIKDFDRNKIGHFPIYTTEQLLKTAREYLSGLGES